MPRADGEKGGPYRLNEVVDANTVYFLKTGPYGGLRGGGEAACVGCALPPSPPPPRPMMRTIIDEGA